MKELVINFHGVGRPPAGIDDDERRYWWDEVGFEEFLDQIASEQSNCPIQITFDDGNMSDASIALPALVERELKATFFICPGRVGTEHYLDIAAIENLLRANMPIGSHGLYHVNLRRCTDLELKAEVGDSKRMLEDICGQAVVEIGIPFGSYDRRVLNAIKSAGYTAAYTSDGGFANDEQWLRPRNTLSCTWQNGSLATLRADCSNVKKRLRRSAVGFYKRLR